MANNLPPPKIAIFERVIWSAGRQKSLSVRSGGAGFDRFRHGARNCPFDTSHLEDGDREFGDHIERLRANPATPSSATSFGKGTSAGVSSRRLRYCWPVRDSRPPPT